MRRLAGDGHEDAELVRLRDQVDLAKLPLWTLDGKATSKIIFFYFTILRFRSTNICFASEVGLAGTSWSGRGAIQGVARDSRGTRSRRAPVETSVV